MRKRKVILIGIDSLMVPFIEKYVAEGSMPNIKVLIKQGVFTNALPCLPAHTPTNWATIITGAEPRIHGITGFNIPDGKGKFLDGFSSVSYHAEPLWETAAKLGKKVVLLDYPGSLPLAEKYDNVISIGENGHPMKSLREISFDDCYIMNINAKNATRIKFKNAEGWRYKNNIKNSKEAILILSPENVTIEGDRIIRNKIPGSKDKKIYIYKENDSNYIEIFEYKSDLSPLCRLKEGEWSKWVQLEFRYKKSVSHGILKFKLLCNNRNKFKLYRTQIYPCDNYTKPVELSREITENCGPYLSHTYLTTPMFMNWLDEDSYMEKMEIGARWFANVSKYILTKKPCDIFILKWHAPDHVKHAFWGGIDKISPSYDPKKAEYYEEKMRQTYMLCDEMVGAIRKSCDENTVICVVSDHGHLPTVRTVFLNNLLEKGGWLVYDRNMNIIYEKTIAYADGSMFIYINRNKVSKSEYEKVRTELIKYLSTIKDKKTGMSPFEFVLRSEDTDGIGLYSNLTKEKIGDIIYCMKVGYENNYFSRDKNKKVFKIHKKLDVGAWGLGTSHHGPFMPSATLSRGTIYATFLISGPGIKKGYKRPVPIKLTDVAPTLARILEIPAPRDNSGCVLNDIFE